MGVSQNWGYHFGGPNNKDYNIFGLYIGVPLFWEKLPYGLSKVGLHFIFLKPPGTSTCTCAP